jgi:predicted metal-binding membrane protein
MMTDAQELARVRNPVLFASAITWVLLFVDPGGALMGAHCLAMSTRTSLAAGWVLMLVAMMAPVLIAPIGHLRLRSFSHRRARAITLFVVAYAAIWIAVGGVLLSVASLLASPSYLPAVSVGLIALVWQCSPIKQRCLNRCHAHRELAAFGAAADLDALRFGTTHALWCAGSCWALMLFPLLLPLSPSLPHGHLVAMAAVAILIFSERLEHPLPPRWSLRGRGCGKAIRIVIAQARIRWAVI